MVDKSTTIDEDKDNGVDTKAPVFSIDGGQKLSGHARKIAVPSAHEDPDNTGDATEGWFVGEIGDKAYNKMLESLAFENAAQLAQKKVFRWTPGRAVLSVVASVALAAAVVGGSFYAGRTTAPVHGTMQPHSSISARTASTPTPTEEADLVVKHSSKVSAGAGEPPKKQPAKAPAKSEAKQPAKEAPKKITHPKAAPATPKEEAAEVAKAVTVTIHRHGNGGLSAKCAPAEACASTAIKAHGDTLAFPNAGKEGGNFVCPPGLLKKGTPYGLSGVQKGESKDYECELKN